jgi:hypothetical protein
MTGNIHVVIKYRMIVEEVCGTLKDVLCSNMLNSFV